MLAAGHEPQAEPCLVQQHIGGYQQKRRNEHEPAELKGADAHGKCLFGTGVLNDGGHVIGIGRSVDGLDNDGGPGGAQQVQGCTYQRLIRLEVDTGHSQQAGIHHAHRGGNQHHCQDRHKMRAVLSQIAHRQGTAQSAHDHDALQTQIDHAGVLGEAAAQSHQDQHGGKDQGILQQQAHA